jgi:hypothetical protein
VDPECRPRIFYSHGPLKGLEEPFPEPDKEMLLANLAYFSGNTAKESRAVHQTGKLHRMLSSRMGYR